MFMKTQLKKYDQIILFQFPWKVQGKNENCGRENWIGENKIIRMKKKYDSKSDIFFWGTKIIAFFMLYFIWIWNNIVEYSVRTWFWNFYVAILWVNFGLLISSFFSVSVLILVYKRFEDFKLLICNAKLYVDFEKRFNSHPHIPFFQCYFFVAS